MKIEKIINDLDIIFREVLENDEISLNKDTVANDIEEWDSLSNILLIAEIQKKYNIKFKSSDIIRWANIGEMCETIISLLDK